MAQRLIDTPSTNFFQQVFSTCFLLAKDFQKVPVVGGSSSQQLLKKHLCLQASPLDSLPGFTSFIPDLGASSLLAAADAPEEGAADGAADSEDEAAQPKAKAKGAKAGRRVVIAIIDSRECFGIKVCVDHLWNKTR